MDKKTVFFIAVLALLLIAAPIIVDVLMHKANPLPVNGTDTSAWIGFFGNYLGAVIGGIIGGGITLYGLRLTFQEEKRRRISNLLVFYKPLDLALRDLIDVLKELEQYVEVEDLVKARSKLMDARKKLEDAKNDYGPALIGHNPVLYRMYDRLHEGARVKLYELAQLIPSKVMEFTPAVADYREKVEKQRKFISGLIVTLVE